MRLRQPAALTAAAVTALVAMPTAASAADPAGTLYVNNRATTCTDAGSGAADRPFCTISAAAHAALPGQTVQIVDGSYRETVAITNSGTPDKPITFVGTAANGPTPLHPVLGTKNALVLSNVHDVVVKNFSLYSDYSATTVPLVSVANSSRVVLDRIRYGSAGPLSAQLSDGSDHVTLSRSLFRSVGGIAVGAGVHDSLITANEFNQTTSAAVSAVDAPNTAVTGNSIAFSCAESVKIDGASPGALIENNVITAQYGGAVGLYSGCGATSGKRGETEISVSAASTAGSKVDYNTVHPWSDASAYTWAGTAYPTAAAFAAAQPGQAAHDLDLDVPFDLNLSQGLVLPESMKGAVDSADPSAPGVDTDLLGVRPTDDPNVANTAPNGAVRDRGAYELSGQASVGLAVTADVPTLQGPAPFTVKVTAKPVNTFGLPQADYVFTFGDGTAPVRSTEPTVVHTYTKPGNYYGLSVAATDVQGAQVSGTFNSSVVVKDPAPLAVAFDFSVSGPLNVAVTPRIDSPYVVTKVDVDFGDGGRASSPDGRSVEHRYYTPGSYPVTVTVTDEAGRTSTVTRTVDLDNGAYLGSLQPGQRVQVLANTALGDLMGTGANYTKGVWAPFLSVPRDGAPFDVNRILWMTSATTADQYLRTFVLAEGKIYTADRNLGPAAGGVAQGQWLPWKEVAGPGPLSGLITQISAASIGNSTHLVAVAGARVYEASGDRASGTWSKWGDITAAAGMPTGVYSIAAGTTGNVLHVAVLGADHHVRVADGDYTRGRWSHGDVTAAYGGPAGITQLAAASTPGSRFHVVALANGRVHEITGDYAAGYWTGWGDISAASGLTAVTEVAAASTGNTLRIFGLDGWRALQTVTGDYTAGRWSGAVQVNSYEAAGATGQLNHITAAGL
ncbi:PKD domain-containing protein [Kitasatospora terrestris]|uniref:PKD domain-containing protein n=1 Tax=Kitasatospora terrestris TaxID=258051 RepID=A0ABP9DQL1_9ACTN